MSYHIDKEGVVWYKGKVLYCDVCIVGLNGNRLFVCEGKAADSWSSPKPALTGASCTGLHVLDEQETNSAFIQSSTTSSTPWAVLWPFISLLNHAQRIYNKLNSQKIFLKKSLGLESCLF